jgi:surface protein
VGGISIRGSMRIDDISFFTVPTNPCITVDDLRTKINNNEDVTQLNTSCITDMAYLFYDNNSLNQDISAWDISNVTSMFSMFFSLPNFNQDIGSWNVSNVTNMTDMFGNAGSFNQDISAWDVNNVVEYENFSLGSPLQNDYNPFM